NIQNPITKITIGEEWKIIKATAQSRNSKTRTEKLDRLLPDFNAGLINVLENLTTNVNIILSDFEQNVSVQLNLPEDGIEITREIDNQVISLTANYYNRPLARHHQIFNEARLTAIAISIYLGALLLNPPSQLKVLFLDDILIGLDMANRLP